MQSVDSAIETGAGGVYAPKRIGSCPLMDETAGAEAVASVQKAWDHGMGVWPTMSVADRIAHVEAFTHRMIERREEIVRLMLWGDRQAVQGILC